MQNTELFELKDITTKLFGGYDKKSVRKYVTRIIAENDEELSAARKKADELEKKNGTLAREKESAGLELRKYKQKTEQALKSLMDKLSTQADHIMQLTEQVAKQHRAETQYQRKMEEIFHTVMLIEKRKEEAERESEEIVSGARLAAKVELEKAKHEADGILADAHMIREQAKRESARMIEEAIQRKTQLLGSFGQIMDRFYELYGQVGHILKQEKKAAEKQEDDKPLHPPMRIV